MALNGHKLKEYLKQKGSELEEYAGRKWEDYKSDLRIEQARKAREREAWKKAYESEKQKEKIEGSAKKGRMAARPPRLAAPTDRGGSIFGDAIYPTGANLSGSLEPYMPPKAKVLKVSRKPIQQPDLFAPRQVIIGYNSDDLIYGRGKETPFSHAPLSPYTQQRVKRPTRVRYKGRPMKRTKIIRKYIYIKRQPERLW